jgi:ABC-type sugar transport system permease subunit
LRLLIALSRKYRFLRIACHPFDRPSASALSTARLHPIDQPFPWLTSPKLLLPAIAIARIWTRISFAIMIIFDGLGRYQQRYARNWRHRLQQPFKPFRHVICSLAVLLVCNALTAIEHVITGEAMIAAVSA